jgi:hypothetical protein
VASPSIAEQQQLPSASSPRFSANANTNAAAQRRAQLLAEAQTALSATQPVQMQQPQYGGLQQQQQQQQQQPINLSATQPMPYAQTQQWNNDPRPTTARSTSVGASAYDSSSALASPRGMSPEQLQHALSTVGSSRFINFLPQKQVPASSSSSGPDPSAAASPQPAGLTRPASVLTTYDRHEVTFVPPSSDAYAAAARSPLNTQRPGSAASLRRSPSSPMLQQTGLPPAEIVGVTSVARPAHSRVYTFDTSGTRNDNDNDPGLYASSPLTQAQALHHPGQGPPLTAYEQRFSSSLRGRANSAGGAGLRSPPAAELTGLGSGASGSETGMVPVGHPPRVLSTSPSGSLVATSVGPILVPPVAVASPVVVRPNLMAPPPALPHDELEMIVFKIHGCWDVEPRYLLWAGWAVLALMFLFTCIAFGVSWTSGYKTTDGLKETFFIGRYEGAALTNNGTTVVDVSGSYSGASDWRHQCDVDNARVPAMLACSLVTLLLSAYCLFKRSQHHGAIGWRRVTILSLFFVGVWNAMAMLLWWHGCFTFVRAAVDDASGELLFHSTTFMGGWFLALVNLMIAALMILVQAIAYGSDIQCCYCAC